jgi:hypothetical protein
MACQDACRFFPLVALSLIKDGLANILQTTRFPMCEAFSVWYSPPYPGSECFSPWYTYCFFRIFGYFSSIATRCLGIWLPLRISVSNLALVLQDQGKCEAADEMNRRVLAGREKVLGVEHPSTLKLSGVPPLWNHNGPSAHPLLIFQRL